MYLDCITFFYRGYLQINSSIALLTSYWAREKIFIDPVEVCSITSLHVTLDVTRLYEIVEVNPVNCSVGFYCRFLFRHNTKHFVNVNHWTLQKNSLEHAARTIKHASPYISSSYVHELVNCSMLQWFVLTGTLFLY